LQPFVFVVKQIKVIGRIPRHFDMNLVEHEPVFVHFGIGKSGNRSHQKINFLFNPFEFRQKHILSVHSHRKQKRFS